VATCKLLVELCAGTAAFSWSMVGARFPVSRQGSKSGYSDALKGVLGLHTAPEAFLWVEPDEELARTLALLTTPGGPQAVAEVIRSWIPCPNGHEVGQVLLTPCEECCPDEGAGMDLDGYETWTSTGKQDARRLWDRLRKERPERSPEREAGLLYMQSRQMNSHAVTTFRNGYGSVRPNSARPSTAGFMPEFRPAVENFGDRHQCPRPTLSDRLDALPVARHLVLSASNRLIHATTHPDGTWRNTGNGGTRFGGEFATSAEDVAARVEDAGRYIYVAGNAWRPGEPASGFVDPETGGRYGAARVDVARRLSNTPTMPPTSVICCGAEEVDPAAVLEAYGVEGADVVVYMDGPYHGRCEDDGAPIDGSTTGYLHLFGRKEQLEVATAWSETGATVVISECVPLCGTMKRLHGGQWWSTEITDTRRGQARSFSTARGRTEWLTMNRKPVARCAWPARDALPGQGCLFG